MTAPQSVRTGRVGVAVVIATICWALWTAAQVTGQSPPASIAAAVEPAQNSAAVPASGELPRVPEPKQVGGESESIVQVANLIYAGVKSSHCFSDHFLIEAEKASSISTSRRFHAVKSSSDEIYNFPLVVMTGEGEFSLTEAERQNLREYIERGGFLLASAGCSSQEWDHSFRREIADIFPEYPLAALGMDHPVFNTVERIDALEAKHGEPQPLQGITIAGRLCVIYSQDGLNDTAHTQGCCCCGGNEIVNSVQVNVNVLAYALVF